MSHPKRTLAEKAEILRTDAARWRRYAKTRPMRKTVDGEQCLSIAYQAEALADLIEFVLASTPISRYPLKKNA